MVIGQPNCETLREMSSDCPNGVAIERLASSSFLNPHSPDCPALFECSVAEK